MFPIDELFIRSELDFRTQRARTYFTDRAVARQNRRARRNGDRRRQR